MYVHIGNDVTLPDLWVVAVFDLDRSTEDSALCREYLLRAEKEGRLQWLGPEVPRAVVVAIDRVYLTAVRAETLRERLRHAGKITGTGRKTIMSEVNELFYTQSDTNE